MLPASYESPQETYKRRANPVFGKGCCNLSDSELDDREEQGEKSEVEETTPEERRKSYRLNKVLGATLTPKEGEAKTTRLFVIDISTTGFKATDHSPPAEEDYEISIVLERGEEPFVSAMRVVWVKELTVSGMYQMGCEFLDTDTDQLDKLADFIEQEIERASGSPHKTVDIGRPWTMIG